MSNAAVKPRLFVFYLAPDFTLLAFSSAVEALRLANLALGREAYAWRLATAEGGESQASCGVALKGGASLAQERARIGGPDKPFMIVVCGGLNVERAYSRALGFWLREARQNGVAVASLCTGAYLLAQAKLLDDRKCVIHWESFPGFVEKFEHPLVRSNLFEIDQGVYTCAGGSASFDMMLHVILGDLGEAIARKVCELAITDRIRSAEDRQRPYASRAGTHHPVVAKLIARMQETLADPAPIDELMTGLGVTRRQVERLFRFEIQSSPARYYLKLRLEYADRLLMQTKKTILDVAVASGFSSASHFAKCYREVFGASPQLVRKRAEGAAQARLQPA